MYFCLKCNQYHEECTAARIFITGFRTEPFQEKVPLGICEVDTKGFNI